MALHQSPVGGNAPQPTQKPPTQKPGQGPDFMKAMQYALSPSGAIGGNPIVQGGAQAVQGLPDLMRKIQNAPPSLVHAVQQYLQGVPGNLPQAPGQEKLINMITSGAVDGMTPPSPSPQPQQ